MLQVPFVLQHGEMVATPHSGKKRCRKKMIRRNQNQTATSCRLGTLPLEEFLKQVSFSSIEENETNVLISFTPNKGVKELRFFPVEKDGEGVYKTVGDEPTVVTNPSGKLCLRGDEAICALEGRKLPSDFNFTVSFETVKGFRNFVLRKQAKVKAFTSSLL